MSVQPVSRLSVQVSHYVEDILTLWAYVHAKPISAYAAQILSARAEANRKEVQEEIGFIARRRNMTYEELETEILSEGDRKRQGKPVPGIYEAFRRQFKLEEGNQE